MCVPYLPAGQGDEMSFCHPVHVSVRCNRFVVGLGGYPLLQWAKGIYRRVVCEVFVLRILSLSLGCDYFYSIALNIDTTPLLFHMNIWHCCLELRVYVMALLFYNTTPVNG